MSSSFSSYIDSNIFFYAKINERIFGESCSGILRAIAGKELSAATSVLTLVEVANAMRKYNLQDIEQDVHALYSLGPKIYGIESSDMQDAIEIYGDYKISPYDCLHASIMKRTGVNRIISADKEFDKIPWIKRLEPRKLLEDIRKGSQK